MEGEDGLILTNVAEAVVDVVRELAVLGKLSADGF